MRGILPADKKCPHCTDQTVSGIAGTKYKNNNVCQCKFFTPEIRAYWDLLIRSMASTEVAQGSVASLQGDYLLFLSLHPHTPNSKNQFERHQ